jgi:hypothetical protein
VTRLSNVSIWEGGHEPGMPPPPRPPRWMGGILCVCPPVKVAAVLCAPGWEAAGRGGGRWDWDEGMSDDAYARRVRVALHDAAKSVLLSRFRIGSTVYSSILILKSV